MTKIQMIQTIGVIGIATMILSLSLGHLIFEFVSNFEIRISNFASAETAHHALWAYTKAGSFGPGFFTYAPQTDGWRVSGGSVLCE